MKNFNSSVFVLVIGLAFSIGVLADMAMADTMSSDEHMRQYKAQYKAMEKGIAAEYKADKAKCGSLSGNASDVCMAEAKGKKHIAKAELNARYKPSDKTQYDLSLAKAEAACSIAMTKCDDKIGNDKDVCVEEAESAKAHAISNAKGKMHTSQSDAVVDKILVDANVRPSGKAISRDPGKIRSM